MDRQTVEDYILSMAGSQRDFPFGKDIAVYAVNDDMFALVDQQKSPVNISLKCDPRLAQTLREKYDEVMPGQNLNKKHWITIVLSGQLSWPEVQDLIRHSYILASSK